MVVLVYVLYNKHVFLYIFKVLFIWFNETHKLSERGLSSNLWVLKENQVNIIYSSFPGYSFLTRFDYQCVFGCFGKPHAKQTGSFLVPHWAPLGRWLSQSLYRVHFSRLPQRDTTPPRRPQPLREHKANSSPRNIPRHLSPSHQHQGPAPVLIRLCPTSSCQGTSLALVNPGRAHHRAALSAPQQASLRLRCPHS